MFNLCWTHELNKYSDVCHSMTIVDKGAGDECVCIRLVRATHARDFSDS